MEEKEKPTEHDSPAKKLKKNHPVVKLQPEAGGQYTHNNEIGRKPQVQVEMTSRNSVTVKTQTQNLNPNPVTVLELKTLFENLTSEKKENQTHKCEKKCVVNLTVEKVDDRMTVAMDGVTLEKKISMKKFLPTEQCENLDENLVENLIEGGGDDLESLEVLKVLENSKEENSLEIETRKVLKASDRRQTRTLVRNFENLSLLTKFKFKRMDDYEKSRKLEIDALQNSEVLKRNQAMKMIFAQDFSDRNCLHYTGLMGADQAEQLDTHPPPQAC